MFFTHNVTSRSHPYSTQRRLSTLSDSNSQKSVIRDMEGPNSANFCFSVNNSGCSSPSKIRKIDLKKRPHGEISSEKTSSGKISSGNISSAKISSAKIQSGRSQGVKTSSVKTPSSTKPDNSSSKKGDKLAFKIVKKPIKKQVSKSMRSADPENFSKNTSLEVNVDSSRYTNSISAQSVTQTLKYATPSPAVSKISYFESHNTNSNSNIAASSVTKVKNITTESYTTPKTEEQFWILTRENDLGYSTSGNSICLNPASELRALKLLKRGVNKVARSPRAVKLKRNFDRGLKLKCVRSML